MDALADDPSEDFEKAARVAPERVVEIGIQVELYRPSKK